MNKMLCIREYKVLFRKREFTHEKVGTLIFRRGIWEGEHSKLFFYLEGTKAGPSEIALEQSLNIRVDSELFRKALDYLMANETEISSSDVDCIEPESIWFYSELGKFDVVFGQTTESWEYTVHFLNANPENISVAH